MYLVSSLDIGRLLNEASVALLMAPELQRVSSAAH